VLCLCMRGLLVGCDVIPNPLNHSYVSPMCSQPSFTPNYLFDMPNDISKLCDSKMNLDYDDNMLNLIGGSDETFESLGYLCGYDSALDPYCIFLVDKSRKIIWNTFFDFSFDFSLVFTLLKRALTLFAVIICVLSYSQAWKPFAEELNKFLRALTVFEWRARVLTYDGVADAP